MTREEIRDRILFALNDNTTTPVAFTLSELNDVIDEASEIVAEEVSELQRTAYAPMGEGQMFYTIHQFADNVMTPYRLWLSDDEKRLDFITMRQLDGERIRWMEAQTSGSAFPNWWFPVSWDTFGLWPGNSAAAGTLRMDYLAWPDALFDDGDSPPWSDATHDSIVTYGIYDGLMQQWEFLQAMDVFQAFVATILDRSFQNEFKQTMNRFMHRLDYGLGSPVDRLDFPG